MIDMSVDQNWLDVTCDRIHFDQYVRRTWFRALMSWLRVDHDY